MVILPCAFTLHGGTGNSGQHLSLLKLLKCSIKITVKHTSALHATELMDIRTEYTVRITVI